MRRPIVISTVLLTAVLAGGGALALVHGSASKMTAAPAPPPVPVVAGTVDRHDVPIYLTGVGTVIAYNTDVVRSQIQGQITSINFTEGQTVHPGDLLAQIDPRPYQAQIDQYTANLDRDQAQLANALANLNRYTPLEQKGWATPQLLETQKAQVAQNGLVVVTQIEPISLIFTLPETVLPQIQQQQQKTKSPLKVIAYSQDNRIKLDEGELGLVNNEIVQTTGSIQLKANFPNKVHRLWPGELVNARLLVDTRHDGLTVPASVVQQGPEGANAYVINQDGTVSLRAIKVAEIADGQALIDSGLAANEQVVVDGQYKLQPGARVEILHGKAAAEAAAQSAQQAPIP